VISAFQEVFRADFESGKLFWKQPPKNHAELIGTEAGYICIGKNGNKNYWQIRAFGRTFKRSRIMFLLANGYWPDPCVDHISGNSLDDRPVNLRECNYSQNSANSKSRDRDLPRGVHRTRQGKFMARVTVNGETRSLGTFNSPTEAGAVAAVARKEAFHEFA
jgi:hypothetical protein